MIIELPALNRSASAARRDKHWIKQLTGVDRTAKDGYAFQGDFVPYGATVEVPEGTWFLGFCEDRSGSGYLRSREVTLWQARDAEALTVAAHWDLDGKPGWALKVRDAIADHLDGRNQEPAPAPGPHGLTPGQLGITKLALHRLAFSAPDTEVTQDMRDTARAALKALEEASPA